MDVHVITDANKAAYAAELDQLFRIRHRIYVEEKKWREPSDDGRETDQFDTEHAVHLVGIRNGQIIAGSRFIPTTQPHLLSEVFPHLCTRNRRCPRLRCFRMDARLHRTGISRDRWIADQSAVLHRRDGILPRRRHQSNRRNSGAVLAPPLEAIRMGRPCHWRALRDRRRHMRAGLFRCLRGRSLRRSAARKTRSQHIGPQRSPKFPGAIASRPRPWISRSLRFSKPTGVGARVPAAQGDPRAAGAS